MSDEKRQQDSWATATDASQPLAMQGAQDPASERRRMFAAHLIAFAAVFVALLSLQCGAFDWTNWVEWLDWRAYPDNSIALNEALAWWSGHLGLPTRLWDTALVPGTGEIYNVFPPMQTVLWFVCTAIPAWRADPSSIPGIVPFVLFGLPLPIVAYAVFADRVGSPKWAAVMTLSLLCGTAVAPCFVFTRVSYVFHTAHILSQVGLLLLANEVLGRRRVWLMAIALAIAVWSRQLAIFYAFAMLYAAWKGPADRTTQNVTPVEPTGAPAGREAIEKQRSVRRLAAAAAAILLVSAVPAALNWAKFGSPTKSGYALIYEGRDDPFAQETRAHGLFSPRYMGRNFVFMNICIPREIEVEGRRVLAASPNGTSIWLTTPLLAFAVVGALKARRESGARWLLACTIPVIVAILCYHATGATQVGYYRFALDYIPIWLVAGAAWCTTGRLRWATAICTLWSVGYFAFFCWALSS